MEYQPVPTKESSDFLCPSCGAGAFEIADRPWTLREGGVEEEFLVLRCLGCLELFHHHLTPELEEPGPCLTETVNTEVS